MLTPKEFRITAIPELVGFLLFFLYCIFDWPLLYIKSYAPYTGNVMIEEKGIWTFCSEIDTIFFQTFIYMLGTIFILFTIFAILKCFVSKPSWAVYLHTRTMTGMATLSVLFLILPTVFAIAVQNSLEKNQFIIYINYTVTPAFITFIMGLVFTAITIYSTKQCMKCYDAFPKQVSKALWPYFSKSWLEKHYGKNNIEVNTEKTEVPADTETFTEEQSPKEETEKTVQKQDEPKIEENIITTRSINAASVQTVQQTETAPKTETSYKQQSQYNQPSNKKKHLLIAGGIAAVLLIAGTVLYISVYKPYAKDRDALRTYVGATNVFLRSSQIAGVENNILGKINYGSEVITYEKGAEWSHVKVNDVEGYMASSYLLDQTDFELLNSVWGNEEAKENIATFRCRMAILDFYKQNEMSGGTTGWQIYTKETEGLPNTVTYPKLYEKEGEFANFFFIVKNNTTGNRRLAGYSFEDETEKPVFRFVIDVPEYGDIKRIRTYKGDMTIEFDNRKKVSFPYYHSSYDYEVKQPSDSTVTPVINGNIKLIPGIEYWVEGIIGKEYPIKGSLRINTSNKLWFQYVINDGRKIEEDDYGIYDNGKMIFDSGMEATITDKIEGLWGEYYLKPYLPLELHVIGYGLTGKQDTPPAPAPPVIPKIEDILTVTDEKTAQEPQAKEEENTETQIAYIPPVIEEEPEDDNQIYDKVEQMPGFPGGQSALMSFLSRNVKYPKVCQENGIQGRVIIQFVVNKDGNISDVSVYKGVNPYLDSEAIRVVKSMPKWIPGKQKGKYVNVRYTLPISFRLG